MIRSSNMKIVLNYVQAVYLFFLAQILFVLSTIKRAKNYVLSVLFTALLLASVSARAALDPAVVTTFTTIQSDFTSMMGLVWPVIGAVFAALAIIGLGTCCAATRWHPCLVLLTRTSGSGSRPLSFKKKYLP